MKNFAHSRPRRQRRKEAGDFFFRSSDSLRKIQRHQRGYSCWLTRVGSGFDGFRKAFRDQFPKRGSIVLLRLRQHAKLRPKFVERAQNSGFRDFATEFGHELGCGHCTLLAKNFPDAHGQGRNLRTLCARRSLFPGFLTAHREHVAEYLRRGKEIGRVASGAEQVQRQRRAFGNQPRRKANRNGTFSSSGRTIRNAKSRFNERRCRCTELLSTWSEKDQTIVVDPGAHGIQRQKRLAILMPGRGTSGRKLPCGKIDR